MNPKCLGAQELCESRDGRSALPIPNSRKATLEEEEEQQQQQQQQRRRRRCGSELSSRVNVEMTVPGSRPPVIVVTVPVDVKRHLQKRETTLIAVTHRCGARSSGQGEAPRGRKHAHEGVVGKRCCLPCLMTESDIESLWRPSSATSAGSK